MMKILITGGQGHLGQALQACLTGYELIPLGKDVLDVSQRRSVFTAVSQHQPDIIIHCAAYTHVDGCAQNPALAYQINALGTQHVALACQADNIPLVHISSNEVFAGDNIAGYEEWMPLNPINAYGRSKAAAEFMVRHLVPRHYIVRTAWLYAPGGHNFIHAIINRAHTTGQLRVVTDEVGNPTATQDVARAVAQLLPTQQYGTYHLVNEGACSRWAFANEILQIAGLSNIHNTPILSHQYPRASTPPPYAALHNIAGAALGITLRPWQAALTDYIQQYVISEN